MIRNIFAKSSIRTIVRLFKTVVKSFKTSLLKLFLYSIWDVFVKSVIDIHLQYFSDRIFSPYSFLFI